MVDIDKYRIGKVFIVITSLTNLVRYLKEYVTTKNGGYICVSNMRTVRYANLHDDYLQVMQKSLMNIPDGMPLIWFARVWGIKNAERTMGPHLFKQMIDSADLELKHFLLGDTEDTLNRLVERVKENNGGRIVGTMSPPFCSIDEYDYEDIVTQIQSSKANIVWLSLSAPKQDFLAARLTEYLPNVLFIGVGAAFRFYLGEYKEPKNKVIQKMGLTGLFFRKLNTKELKWYIVHISWLIKMMVYTLWQKVLGKQHNSID